MIIVMFLNVFISYDSPNLMDKLIQIPRQLICLLQSKLNDKPEENNLTSDMVRKW